MKLKVLVIVLLVVVGGAAVVVSLGLLPGTSAADSATYLTAAATTGDVTDEVAATGTIAASSTYAMGFGEAAQLVTDASATVGSGDWTTATVDATVGQAVKQGDVLATAETGDLDRQLTAAELSLASANLGAKLARATLSTANDGTDQTAIDQARIGYYQAVGSWRDAQKTVSDLKHQVALAKLTAPIDGIVTTVNLVAGQPSMGTGIVMASDAYEVTADVVESDISTMSIGQPATVSVGAIDAVIGGTVSQIAPGASSSSGSGSVVTFPVTVTLTGAPSALRSGMTADITIVTDSATNVLTIPSAALRGTAGSYRVQVLGADGKPENRTVDVGLVTSSTAEIKRGLTAGETVITGSNSPRTTTTTTGGFGGGGGTIAIPGGGGGRGFQP